MRDMMRVEAIASIRQYARAMIVCVIDEWVRVQSLGVSGRQTGQQTLGVSKGKYFPSGLSMSLCVCVRPAKDFSLLMFVSWLIRVCPVLG
jgi:hypothetical protein